MARETVGCTDTYDKVPNSPVHGHCQQHPRDLGDNHGRRPREPTKHLARRLSGLVQSSGADEEGLNDIEESRSDKHRVELNSEM